MLFEVEECLLFRARGFAKDTMLTYSRFQNANAADDNVSPIDEAPDASRFEVKQPGRVASASAQQSSIPVMRREKKRSQVAAAAQNLVNRKEIGGSQRPTKDPRWDPYSGEITTSDKGKPQSAKPGQFTPPALRSTRDSKLGNDSSISASSKPQQSFTERMRNLKVNSIITEKPGWKGASGRVTLVNPVADNPDVKPLNVPRKENNIRVVSPEEKSPVSDDRRDETYRHHNPLMSNPSQERVDQPVHSNVSSPRTDSPDSVIHDPFEIRQSVAIDPTRPRSRPESRDRTIPRGVTESTIVRNFHSDLAEAFPRKEEEEPYVEPPSRFSMSTYAPTSTQATPRPSTDTWEHYEMPPLPVPEPPKPVSVLTRARPAVLGDEPRLPRKAVGSANIDPILLSVASSLPARRVSQMSTLSKHLPQSPAEASSNDLISSLQAQVENLRVRRANIAKSIRQMTELMPQDRVVVTDQVRRKREEEKRKIESLREEEAEVVREEHELGLRLHRAYKRRDKEGIYEPTTLWVRRVTG